MNLGIRVQVAFFSQLPKEPVVQETSAYEPVGHTEYINRANKQPWTVAQEKALVEGWIHVSTDRHVGDA